AIGGELGPDADMRPDAEPARHLEQEIELAVTVDDDDRVTPELLRQERGLHVFDVFVAVQDEERFRVVEQRQSSQELRLRAGFEAEIVRTPEAPQFLDDLVLLVHLDRIHAAITAMVAVVTNRRLEAADERAHPAVQHIGEANEERQAEAAALQIENQLVQVDARA